MHELAICAALLRQVLVVATAENMPDVSRITLCIGPLSGVEPSQLRLAFPLLAVGTPCEGAVIEIEAAPVRVRCGGCGQISEARPNRLVCAGCGAWRVSLVSGDELLLARVELLHDPLLAEKGPAHV